MSAVPLDPTCDVCGETKRYRQGIGSFCPNINCGGTATPESLVDDTPPKDGRYVKLSRQSAQVVLQEKLREQPTLTKVDAVDLYGILDDGTERHLSHVMVRVRYPAPDRSPAPTRTTAPSSQHPKGVRLRLASREGVSL